MKKYISGILAVVVLAIIALGLQPAARGVQAINTTLPVGSTWVNGYAWSSNIGWINFHGTAQNGAVYGVHLSTTTGALGGYAWSSNIGWIKFGGLYDIPVTTLASSTNASVNLVTGEVYGYARACAGTVPGNCTSSASRSDGWDGWIELSGKNHLSKNIISTSTAGVWMNPKTGYFSGYAWGGDVVGWISFNTIAGMGVTTANPPVIDNGGEGSITAFCRGYSSADGVITYEAYASGGTAPYEFSWGSGFTTEAKYSDGKVYANKTQVTGPKLIVRDSQGKTIQPYSCPTVIAENNDPSEALSLKVGYSEDKAGVHSTSADALKVKLGEAFVFVYTVDLDQEIYSQCSPEVIKLNGSSGPWPEWEGAGFDLGNRNVKINIPANSTSNQQTGTYEFKLVCTPGDPDLYDPNVYVKSVSSFVTLRRTSESER